MNSSIPMAPGAFRKSTRLFLFHIISFVVILSSGCQAQDSTATSTSDVTPVSPVLSADVESQRGALVGLAKSLKPSVVFIKVLKRENLPNTLHLLPNDPFFRRFFEDFQAPPKEREVAGQGSGFIISDDGYIVTNNHVVGGATEIEVTLLDGTELKAELVGADIKTDIALLKVKPKSSLPAVKMGNSDQAEVGEWVMAIGNPFGLEATVTVGVLSGKERVIGAGPYDDFLQTDASINPGNSGGPLFNLKGEVIGVNTAIIASGQGIGFAVPINLTREIVEQLKDGGSVQRGYVGLGIQDLTPSLKRALGYSPETKGAVVGQVVKNGPADRAGAQEGDLVVEFDGRPIDSSRSLLKTVAATAVGEKKPLKVLRDGKELILTVEVAVRPDENRKIETEDPRQEVRPQALGFQFQERQGKIVVVDVTPQSPAGRADLKPGDIILKVGSTPIKSSKQLSQLLERPGPHTALLIKRGEGTFYVVIESTE